MKTSAQFDITIAKKYGVEEAIVFELLDTFCRIQRSLDKQKMYRDEVWWCKCPIEVLIQFLPFLKDKKIKEILEKLEKKNAIESKGDEFTTYLQNDTEKKKKKDVEIKKVENEDRIYSFSKLEDGEMKSFEVPGTKLVAMLIHEFRFINPDYKKFYSHKGQRKALLEMTEQYTPEIMFNLLEMVPQANKEKYAPQILTPIQFKSKAAHLITFIQRERNDSSESIF